MKKYILLALFMFLFPKYVAFGQLNNSISITGGFVDYNEKSMGGLMTFTYSKNNSNYEIGLSHFLFEKEYEDEIIGKFSSTNINLGYLYTFLRDRSNTININIGGGVTAGYEKIEKNDDLILKSKSGPVAGVYGSLNLDLYIFDGFAFTIKGNQYYLFKSSTGKTNPFVGAGFKFNF